MDVLETVDVEDLLKSIQFFGPEFEYRASKRGGGNAWVGNYFNGRILPAVLSVLTH
jgi:hypothetical protein